jgi:hypothetical protein
MTDAEARLIAADLRTLRIAAIAEATRIYGESSTCRIDTVTLDETYHKPAEWTHINARKLTVNPANPKYRAHFCEEIHNLYRMERFGLPHIYQPLDDTDRANREWMQSWCRCV